VGVSPGEGQSTPVAGLTGTPAYMSPELTEGDPPSPKSDVFAFGLILVQLLAGRLPVQFTGLAHALSQIRSGAVRQAALELVPRDCKAIVGKALANSPDERPAMAEVLDSLRQLEFAATR